MLGLMWLVVEDHDNLFIMAEVIHFIGIGLLAYKLTSKKNAAGVCACPQAPLPPTGFGRRYVRASVYCGNP